MHLRSISIGQWLTLGLLIVCASSGRADGPADNLAQQVRPVPPPGIELSAEIQQELRAAALMLKKRLPMLPDWAVVDVSQGVTTQVPGNLQDAGFFNEQWQFGK